jgi:hypothetical protein
MTTRIGTDPDGFPVYGRLIDGGTQTVDEIAAADWDLLNFRMTAPIHTGPRQLGVDPDGFPIMGRY